MASPLESSTQQINLSESAEQCERCLDHLKKHATEQKAKLGSGKKHKLLEDMIASCDSNIQSLKAWRAAINKGRQTSDESIRASINFFFQNIISRVADARTALQHRLSLSRYALDKSKWVAAQD